MIPPPAFGLQSIAPGRDSVQPVQRVFSASITWFVFVFMAIHCHAQAGCTREICNYFPIVCKPLKMRQNHGMQRTRLERFGCNHGVLWAGSLIPTLCRLVATVADDMDAFRAVVFLNLELSAFGKPFHIEVVRTEDAHIGISFADRLAD